MADKLYIAELMMRDLSYPNHCRAHVSDIKELKKKKIIILPGNANKDLRSANGMCKIVSDMLGKYSSLCNILCFCYPNMESNMPREKIWKSADDIGRQIFREHFLGLVSTTDENGEVKRISANKAAENMRNVVLFTHCYGSYVAEAIEKEFNHALSNLGYTPAEQQFMMQQMFIMHTNNLSEHLGENETKFNHLIRISKSDKKRQKITYAPDNIQTYILNERLTDDELLLVPLSDNQCILLANQLSKEGCDEHNGGHWEDKKTPVGQWEEEIANGVLREVVLSCKPLTDIKHLIDEAKKHGYIQLKESQLDEISDYGQEYFDDFFETRQKIRVSLAQQKKQR